MKQYKLTIPNKDVRSIFESYINVYNRELINQHSNEIGKCLTDGSLEELRELFYAFMFDAAVFKKGSMDFYIELLEGLLSDLHIISEGNILTAENEDGAVFILIKVSEDFLSLLEDANKACIELKERIDISGINAYGISFFGKSCCINKA